MTKGTVKWFSDQKGYGFITPEGGKKDVFVHFSSVQVEGFKTLREGEAVEFEVTDGPKGEQAQNISPVDGDGVPLPAPSSTVAST